MKNNKSSVATAVFFLVILFSFPAISEEKPTAETSDESIIIPARMPLPNAFNFWQKDRDRSSTNGWEYEFEYTGEYLNALRNNDNKHKQVYHDNLNLKLTIDLEKAKLRGKEKYTFMSLATVAAKLPATILILPGKEELAIYRYCQTLRQAKQ